MKRKRKSDAGKPKAIDASSARNSTDSPNGSGSQGGTATNDTIPATPTVTETQNPQSAPEMEGAINLRAYHGGEAGSETKREVELLVHERSRTDTNAGTSDPQKTFSVTLKIPLSEGEILSETIPWNLWDPAMPTPIVFARRLADDYGLSWSETLELSESLESQLRRYLRDNCTYADPVARKDTLGQLQDKPPGRARGLYGSVTGHSKGGFECAPSRTRPPPQRMPSTTTVASTTSTKGSVRSSKRPGGTSEKVEQVYLDDVQRRLRALTANEVAMQATQHTLDFRDDLLCHCCSQKGASTFHCGRPGHLLCTKHSSKLCVLKTSEEPGKGLVCPICTLDCTCKGCSRRLKALAKELKSRCGLYDTAESVAFDDIQAACRGLEEKGTSPTRKAPISRKADLPIRKAPKVPVSELPREVRDGADLDPIGDILYRTVFNEKGSFLIEEASATSTGEGTNGAVVEDGSVDYCNICRKIGNLLCCDYCPRAFHKACIDQSDVDEDSDEKWLCPCCTKEGQGLPDETVDWSESLAATKAAYEDDDVQPGEAADTQLRILSMLMSAIPRLIKFDFGKMFAEPVDCNAIPTYRSIVKEPMDLGTISKKLASGAYRTISDESLNDAIIRVLRDIELVWHNCFTFNLEGSAVYRMAEVLRRRFHRMASKSWNCFVEDRVNLEVASYAKKLARERGAGRAQLPSSPVPAVRPDAPTPSKHKIIVKGLRTNSRRVCVLDPDSGRVVKIYTSVASAHAAMEHLHKMKHKCEIDLAERLEIPQSIRKLIYGGTAEPKVRLFGYRWLLRDDLKTGKAKFTSKQKSVATEPKKAIPRNLLLNDGTPPQVSEWTQFPLKKKDMISGSILRGFLTPQDAFADWLDTLDGSPLIADEVRSMTVFESQYLKGDRNVGGVFWRVDADLLDPKRSTHAVVQHPSPPKNPPERPVPLMEADV